MGGAPARLCPGPDVAKPLRSLNGPMTWPAERIRTPTVGRTPTSEMTTMQGLECLSELREQGRMTWIEPEHGWVVEPEAVLTALTRAGFAEHKREVARSRRDRAATGGVWEGLNPRTGSVASAVWVNRTEPAGAVVFIDIDGELLERV